MLEGIDAYPLQWPEGWTRTPAREREPNRRYQLTFAEVRRDLLKSLELIGVSRHDVVISSNIELRRDGLPYASAKQPDDPGIAVYWAETRRSATRTGPRTFVPRVMACDCWSSPRDNLRAIGLSLEALRMLKRAGATQVLDRAYQGFTALPPSTVRPWRVVLELQGWREPVTRKMVELAYRRLAQKYHPDKPLGSHTAMQELNAAREAALQEIAE